MVSFEWREVSGPDAGVADGELMGELWRSSSPEREKPRPQKPEDRGTRAGLASGGLTVEQFRVLCKG